MDTQEQEQFIQMMTSLFRTQNSVTDLFFSKRLNEEMENILRDHIVYGSSLPGVDGFDYLRSLRSLEKTLQEILYLEKADVVPLSISRELVLKLILQLTRGINSKNRKKLNPVVEVINKTGPVVTKTAEAVPVPRDKPKEKIELSRAQEKILEFVKQAPDCRTKEVINQFSALSSRTVKRGLKELSDIGRISKRFEGGAVYYSAV